MILAASKGCTAVPRGEPLTDAAGPRGGQSRRIPSSRALGRAVRQGVIDRAFVL